MYLNCVQELIEGISQEPQEAQPEIQIHNHDIRTDMF
jgi:hypothetical protein